MKTHRKAHVPTYTMRVEFHFRQEDFNAAQPENGNAPNSADVLHSLVELANNHRSNLVGRDYTIRRIKIPSADAPDAAPQDGVSVTYSFTSPDKSVLQKLEASVQEALEPYTAMGGTLAPLHITEDKLPSRER